jgi:hypothetical protein
LREQHHVAGIAAGSFPQCINQSAEIPRLARSSVNIHHIISSRPDVLNSCSETRQTFRAVFSEPVLVIPEVAAGPTPIATDRNTNQDTLPLADDRPRGSEKKRPREEEGEDAAVTTQKSSTAAPDPVEGTSRKKKRKKGNNQETR